MKSKKGTVAAIAVIIVLVGIVCIGLLRDFDAQGYVRAILNQRFLGDVTEAEEILEDTSKKELLKQYLTKALKVLFRITSQMVWR